MGWLFEQINLFSIGFGEQEPIMRIAPAGVVSGGDVSTLQRKVNRLIDRYKNCEFFLSGTETPLALQRLFLQDPEISKVCGSAVREF